MSEFTFGGLGSRVEGSEPVFFIVPVTSDAYGLRPTITKAMALWIQAVGKPLGKCMPNCNASSNLGR